MAEEGGSLLANSDAYLALQQSTKKNEALLEEGLAIIEKFPYWSIIKENFSNLQPLFTIANINPKSHAHWWLKVTITCTLEHDQELITQWKDIMSAYSVS